MIQSSDFRISTILQGAISLTVVALLVTYLYSGDNWLVDGWSVAVAVAWLLVIQFQLFLAQRQTFPFLFLLAMYLLLFLAFRPLMLLVVPEQFALLGLDPTAGDVNRTLVYVGAGTIATGFGFMLAGLGCRVSVWNPPTISRRGVEAFLIFAVMALAMHAVNLFTFHVASYSTVMVPWGIGYLYRVFDVDVIAVLVVALGVLYWPQLGGRERAVIILFSIVFTGLFIIGGSRGAIFRLFQGGLFISLASHGNFRMSRRVTAFAVLAFALTVASFPVASAFKSAWNYFPGRDVSWEEALNIASAKIKRAEHFPAGELMVLVGNRLGMSLDTMLPVVAEKNLSVHSVMSLDNSFRQLGNKLVPGDPFGKTHLTGRLYSVVYRDRSLEEIETAYLSDVLTMWGISYLHFGSWFAIAVVFLLAMLFPPIFWKLVQRGVGPFWLVYLFLVLNNTFLMMGLDSWILNNIYQAIPVTVASVLLKRGPIGLRFTSRAETVSGRLEMRFGA